MDSQALPDDIEKLKALVVNYQKENTRYEEEKARYEQEVSRYKQKVQLLEEKVDYLEKIRYAHSSERWTKEDKEQAYLFDEAEAATRSPQEPASSSEQVAVKSHRRKKKGRKKLDPSLPREQMLHDLSDSEKICDCGHELTYIGDDSRETFEFQPAKYWVREDIYRKYSCRHCEGLSNESKPAVRRVEPQSIIPNSFASPSLLSSILISKFEDHLPFYRQERILRRLGVELPRITMCNWSIHVAKKLQPVISAMEEDILNSSHAACDETTLQVLKEANRDARQKSYMWLFHGGTREGPIFVYQYHPTRSGEVPDNFFKDYNGVLLTDGYTGYNALGQKAEITHAGCWAHVRRKFKDAYDLAYKNSRAGQEVGFSETALQYIQKLYLVEKQIRENDYSAEATLDLRQRASAPIVYNFYDALKKEKDNVLPGSALGKAIQYTLSEWPKLVCFLEDGLLPIDNNTVENAIRPFVLGRKNWLFSVTTDGAVASCLVYSIIQTAKANGLEPFWYLHYLLEKLKEPFLDEESMKSLAPHRIQKETIEAFKAQTA